MPLLTTGAGTFPAIGGGGGFSGEGDLGISATPVAWWGLSAYSAATAGSNCVKVRRNGDNATQDIVSLSDGSFDATSFSTFIAGGGGQGFVDTLYDQVGTRHLSASSTGQQPEIILSVYNSKPTMRATGARRLASAGSYSGTGPFSVSAVSKQTSANTGTLDCILSDTFNSVGFGYTTLNGPITNFNGGFHNGANVSSALHSLLLRTGTGTSSIAIDGTSTAITDSTGNWSGTINMFASQFDTTWDMRGDICKVGLYTGVMSSGDLSALRTFDQSYWGTP